MNILLLSASISNSQGGVAKVSRTLAKEFEIRGINTYFAFYYADGLDVEASKKIKFDEHSSLSEFSNLILPFIDNNKIDIIINQEQYGDLYINFYKKLKSIRSNIKIINCMHNVPDFNKYWDLGWKHKIKQKIQRVRLGYTSDALPYREMYDVVDKFILLSESYIKIAKKYFGLKNIDKLVAINNPLPFDIDLNSDFTKKKKQFLIVTRFDEHQKNLKAALRIWKKFEDVNDEYKLIVAGYGHDEKLFFDYVNTLNLKRFHFVGRSENPTELYRDARFFLMTSHYEGFSMTLIEAQSKGCIPFVFDSFSAVHDIIEDGQNGFIIQNKNENEFCNRMLKAVADQNLCAQMSNEAIKRVSKFLPNTIGVKWQSLFEQLNRGIDS